MQRALFAEEEVWLAHKHHLKYQGTARVNLNQIHFEPPLSQDLSSKTLDWLRHIFHEDGCRCFDIENHAPVIVSQHDLADLLHCAGVTAHALLINATGKCPSLHFSVNQLQGLHGCHHIQARSELLDPIDCW